MRYLLLTPNTLFSISILKSKKQKTNIMEKEIISGGKLAHISGKRLEDNVNNFLLEKFW